MTNTKPFVIVLALLIVVAGGVFVARRIHTDEADSRSLSQTELKTLAWNTFAKYRDAAKAHDFDTLASLSYQLSDVCKNNPSGADCQMKMDVVASTTKDFNESDFTTMWYDDKQIILTSDWHEEETDLAFGDGREVIIFTRTDLGNPKILFFTMPEEIVYTLKGNNETKAKWRAEVTAREKDTDMDGSADEVETCSYPNASSACVKTDPTKRDTDGDGWWDSTQSFFYSKTEAHS